MARPKAFEREQALDQAMHLFWQQGYEATSLPELLNTMGIGRQSLYDTFGGKHQLFMESLTRYRRTIWDTLGDLQSPNASIKDVRAWFGAMAEFFDATPHKRACLLINCTMELAPHNDVLIVATYDPLGASLQGRPGMLAADRGATLEIPSGAAFENSFRQAFARRLDEWTEIFRALRVPVLPISAAEPVADQLRTLFGQKLKSR